MARRTLIVAALAALVGAPAAAQVGQKKKELAKIQSELRKTREELDRLRDSEKALGHDVNRLAGLDAASRRRTFDLQLSILRAETRRADLQGRLDLAGRVDDFWTAALAAETARHVASLAGAADYFRSRDLWSDEYRRAAILEKVRHLRGLKGFRKKTEEEADDVKRTEGDLSARRRKAQVVRDKRRKEYEAKRVQLEQTQSKVADAARRAKDLEESAKALTSLIDMLAKSTRSHRPTGTPATLDLPRNSLPWPAEGRVVSGFGREKDPELGTWMVRQGLTMATLPGAPVSAVADGKVIFAGPFRSYGSVVILDHGGGFFSVYGQLGDIDAAKGTLVKAGDSIAVAGGGADAGRMYFEVRRGTDALDPTVWLEKR